MKINKIFIMSLTVFTLLTFFTTPVSAENIRILQKDLLQSSEYNTQRPLNTNDITHLDVNTSATNINDPSVFLKQPNGSVTCTLYSNAMMLRRRAILNGDTNWSAITADSMEYTTWIEGVGMKNSYTYAGIEVNSYSFSSSNKLNQIISLLENHPEGIVGYNKNIPHAVLLTDYNASTGIIYCADPSNWAATGRIPLSQSTLNGTQNDIVSQLSSYWCVTNGSIHTHNYTLKYETAHPHKEYKYCSCGNKVYTGKVKYLSTCSSCAIAGFTASVSSSKYQIGNYVTFNMNAKNVTAYAAYIYKDGVTVRSFAKSASGEYTMYIRGDLEPGCYSAIIQARNGAYTTNSETLYFTVTPKEIQYKNNTITVSDKILLPSTYRKKGTVFTCGGSIKSTTDLEYVLVDVYDGAGKLATGYSIYPTAGTRTCNLSNFTSKLDFAGLPVGAYTFVVTARNNSGAAYLARHSFFVTTDLTAKLNTPVVKLDTTTMESGNLVTAYWGAVPNASEYVVSLIQSPSGWSDIKQSATTKGTSFSFQIFEPGKYSIFVVARDSSCYRSEQSTWQTFTVTNTVDTSDYQSTAQTRIKNKEYYLYDSNLSWRMADSVAKAMGGNLATIESESEQNALYTMIFSKGTKDRYWLGGTNFCDPSTDYTWINGEKLSYTNWNTSEPTKKKEHWMMIYRGNGKWNDLPVYGSTASEMGFIVEKEIKTIPIENIKLNVSELTMDIGDTQTLTTVIFPSNATDADIIWSSSDKTIVSVNNGKITAVASGSATITATTNNGKTDTCKVTVTNTKPEIIAVTGIALDKNNVTLDIGESVTLAATVTPENATNKTVTWRSSNTSIVTVNSGKITAIAPGSAVITATTNDSNKTANCNVTVNENVIKSISLSKSPSKLTYLEGEELDISGSTIYVSYSDGSKKEVNLTKEMISGFNSKTAGTKKLTITYGTATTSFEISINHNYVTRKTLPTCTEKGYTTYICACGDSYIDHNIEALGHTVVIDTAIPATCIEDGLTEGSHCSVCDEILTEQKVIPQIDHQEVIDPAKKASCTEIGLTEGIHCSYCGTVIIKQEKIQAKGHSLVIDTSVPATCTTTGLSEGSHCSVCGETLKAQTEIAATDHYWDNGIITKEPTGTETGIKTYTCSCCKATQTEIIPVISNPIHFTDVNDNDWFAPYVYDLATQGIISGRSDTIFDPQGNITRAEFAKILAYASNDDLTKYQGASPFSDTISHWSKTNINWAYKNKIVSGIGNGKFAPDERITREQMAAMICRYAAYKGITLTKTYPQETFADHNDIANWSVDNVYTMQQAGIINGYNEQNKCYFKPQGNATRAEAAKMISVFLQL